MSDYNLRLPLALVAFCAGFICICIFVIPREKLVLILVLSGVVCFLFIGALVVYCFGCKIIQCCCQSKKKESLLDLESQEGEWEGENKKRNMSSDDTFDRSTIKNHAVNWKEYVDTCKN
jgi:hypothetical protein